MSVQTMTPQPQTVPPVNGTGDAILDVQGVTVSFDGFKALNDMNFSMARDELRFVIGPNGAGKTTLLDVITGKTRPQTGKILFDGKMDVLHVPEHLLVQRGIARKFQTPSIFASLSVYENLEAAVGFNDTTRSLFSTVSSEDKDRIEHALTRIGLKDRAHTRAGTLAHGQKQWLEIGMLLVQDPKLLLLDEPVAGMTRAERTRTGELLQAIAESCSVLVVEHDMEFVREFATTVTVLHMGQLFMQGPVADVQNDPDVIEIYIGRSRNGH